MEISEIKKYLYYIRDISKKLSIDKHLDKVFVDLKRGSFVSCITDSKIVVFDGKKVYINDSIKSQNRKSDIIRAIEKVLQNPNYRLFYGAGAIFLKKGSLIGGPLLVKEIDIVDNSIMELQNDTFVNLDILSKIIESSVKNIDEENENDILISSNIEVVIKKLEEKVSSIKSFNSKQMLNLAVDILDTVIEMLDINKFYHLKKVSFNYEQLFFEEFNLFKRKIKEDEILFLNKEFIFISKVPHELSTYKSISMLIDEIENKNTLNNQMMNKILNGVFSSKLVKVERKIYEEEKIEKYIDMFLPVSLSEKQKSSIKKAFTSEIAYIQGPPGTGKSHTIVSMILLSIIMGKKVLVVSHKKPAVEVIKEKLDKLIKTDINVMPYVYIDSDSKRELKEKIQSLLNIGFLDIKKMLNKESIEIRTLLSKISETSQDINKIEKTIEESLELLLKQRELNENFIKIRKYFERTFYSVMTDDNFMKPIRKIKEDISFINNKIIPYIDNITKNLNLYNIRFYLSALKILNDKIYPLSNIDFIIDKCYKIGEIKSLSEEAIRLLSVLIELENIKSEISRKEDIEKTKQRLIERLNQFIYLKDTFLRKKNLVNILEKLNDSIVRDNLELFSKMLNYKKIDRIKSYMENIDFEKILEIFPIWISEISNLNQILPFEPAIFDLVIVDESSQVNLADIMPVIYRGKSLCIVGDHKQLSLVSTGINLKVGRKIDEITWAKYRPGNISYKEASLRNLTISKSSILDFISSDHNNIDIPRETLDEHYRSLPALASFTNENFYDGNLKIMTETPDKININPFYVIKVQGKRDRNKIIIEEAKEVINIVKSVKATKKYKHIDLTQILPNNFTIGIISVIRNQIDYIQELLEGENIMDIITGTPEEMQGHEADLIIISFGADSSASKTHYENKNRFNVMTSRAKYFTFFVYSGAPHNFLLTKKYIQHFGYNFEEVNEKNKYIPIYPLGWKLDYSKFESEFELYVYEILEEYKDIKKKKNIDIEIYNQVKSCGKRIDFVLYNKTNGKFVGIEVDGIYHFELDGKTYTEKHIERIEILKRAGWNIINTPYYRWFDRFARLRKKEDPVLKEEISRVYSEIDRYII